MQQLELWDEREAAQKRKRSGKRAPATPRSRVAWLRRWRNKFTGETCELTTDEFRRSKNISEKLANVLITRGRHWKSDWLHEGALHRTIQGDVVDWLTKRNVPGASNSVQVKDSVSKAWDKSLLILAFYAQGKGIKTIAKSLSLNNLSVMLVLQDSGVNTSARRNYHKETLRTRTGSKERYQKAMENPALRIKKRVMNRIWCAMRRQSVNGMGSFSLVGCSPGFLRDHIAKQFAPGMSFDNYGKWHVDHIRPCASFDLNDPEQLAECFNWRNLQPLWASDNLRKSDSYA